MSKKKRPVRNSAATVKGKRTGAKRAAPRQRRLNSQTIALIALAAVLIVGALGYFLLFRPNQQSTVSSGGVPTLIATAKYSSAPPMMIDPKKQYTATVKMARGGEFVIQLYPDKAPITVNSFVFLARQGFYNGVTFHRVLEGFMAQGGDPTGTGGGGPGYEFVNEDSDLTFDKPGVVAMANAGRDTNGSQFFITFTPQERLNGGYTIFGQVISGMDVVNHIRLRDPDQNPDYPGDAIENITITEK